jgi:hypothetical protein
MGHDEGPVFSPALISDYVVRMVVGINDEERRPRIISAEFRDDSLGEGGKFCVDDEQAVFPGRGNDICAPAGYQDKMPWEFLVFYLDRLVSFSGTMARNNDALKYEADGDEDTFHNPTHNNFISFGLNVCMTFASIRAEHVSSALIDATTVDKHAPWVFPVSQGFPGVKDGPFSIYHETHIVLERAADPPPRSMYPPLNEFSDKKPGPFRHLLFISCETPIEERTACLPFNFYADDFPEN